MVLLQLAGVGVFVLFLVFAIGAPLVLYALVRSEHDQQTTMSRTDGERVARRDSRNENH